ncbi:hypothetical protein Scep_029529 [Stephania cephalantha]|uniref:MADS-box domain-containing protein n=1 Tax=Stephania cephalantha TaxID=152367 RepID=A0AAP0E156_9MAGN
MGRRKIEITKILDEKKRHVTFSKRRQGLLNKARGLFTNFCIVVFSPAGKPFSMSSNNTSVEALLEPNLIGLSKRKMNLKKKLYELCTLCNVEAFMICFNGPGGDLVDMWPEDPRELRRLVHRYEEIQRSNESLDDDDGFWWDHQKRIQNFIIPHSSASSSAAAAAALNCASADHECPSTTIVVDGCGGDQLALVPDNPTASHHATLACFDSDLPLLSEISALDINNYHRHCSLLDVPSPMPWTVLEMQELERMNGDEIEVNYKE